MAGMTFLIFAFGFHFLLSSFLFLFVFSCDNLNPCLVVSSHSFLLGQVNLKVDPVGVTLLRYFTLLGVTSKTAELCPKPELSDSKDVAPTKKKVPTKKRPASRVQNEVPGSAPVKRQKAK